MRARTVSGVTLVELLVGLTLLTGVVLAVGAVLDSGFAMWGQSSAMGEADRLASRTLHRLAHELGHAGTDTLIPDPVAPDGASALSFQRAESFDGSSVVFGDRDSIDWRVDPMETADDGVDNDGDGLVDEGEVVIRRNADTSDEQVTVVLRNVASRLEGETANNADDNGNGLEDERGLAFVRRGNLLMIWLTVQRVDPVTAEVTQRTLETAVALRN